MIERRQPEQIVREVIDRHVERFETAPPDSVVYFVRRRPDGPVKIGTTGDLFARTMSFLNGSPDLVEYALTLPGGQPLEHFFHRRHQSRQVFNEWYDPAAEVLEDAEAFADILPVHIEMSKGDTEDATVYALWEFAPEVKDLFQLWRNKVPVCEIARLTGLTDIEVRGRLRTMRALGFDIPHRRVYGARMSIAS